MNKILIILLIILNAPLLVLGTDISTIPFKVGEYLEYEISAFGIKVATQKTKVVKITNISDKETFYIKTEIKTTPEISKIYFLHDVIESFIDTKTLLPIKIHTIIREGKWRNEIFIDIDQENQNLIYRDKKGEFKLNFNEKLVGLESVLFYLRVLNYSENDTLKLAVSKKREIIYIKAKVKQNYEKLYIKPLKREVNTIYYESEGGEKAGIWLTADEKRIPVKIKSVLIPIGDYGVISFVNKLVKYREE